MSYITREDGTRFVIPSYRDILSAKKASLFKKEIQLLSANYGEYITLQRKNADQYEVAFSSDTGYLLGETVWHYFKKPNDLIYCEVITGTTEAILVIVKNGSVYLDGSFPIDSIPDELVVFQTQQAQFQIYIHGDLPISQQPEEGKFSLDASRVKSFEVLPQPLFPVLPLLPAYQLGLVNAALLAQGIGVLPVKQIGIAAGVVGAIVLGYLLLSLKPVQKQIPVAMVPISNPLQDYMDILASPSPKREMENVIAGISKLYTAPGWLPDKVTYANGTLTAHLVSSGIRIQPAFAWAQKNKMDTDLSDKGLAVSFPITTQNRIPPHEIFSLEDVIAKLIDRESYVLHGKVFKTSEMETHGRFSTVKITMTVDDLPLDTLDLVVKQYKALPLILSQVDFTTQNGRVSGTITLQALGS